MNTEINKLLPISLADQKSILRSKKNIIISSKQQLKKYALEAFRDKTSNKNLYLGVISDETIYRIKKEITDISIYKKNKLFLQTKKYQLAINQDEIRHLKKDSLTISEILEFLFVLDDLIVNFDFVRYTLYNNSQDGLRFKKEMNDGIHIAYEVISNQKGTLRTQALFLQKADFIIKKEVFFQRLINKISQANIRNGWMTNF